MTQPKETKPTYYWDKESKSYKDIPKVAPRVVHQNGDVFKNEAQIAAESPQFTYDDLVEKEWRDLNERVKPTQVDPIHGSDAFRAGFKRGWDISGELAGQTGFINGAKLAVTQLTEPLKTERPLAGNRTLEGPGTQLQTIRRDQLTADICNILATYGILPTEVKVAGVLDALQSTLGVRFKRELRHE